MKKLLVFLLGVVLSATLLNAKGVISENDAGSQFAKLTGNVWWDKDLDGQQNEVAQGISGIRVHLYKNGQDTGKMVETTTIGVGAYSFENLEPNAKYTIKIDLPKNYSDFTLQNKGSDSTSDSDIVNWPWRSESLYLEAGDHGVLDAGLICNVCGQLHMEKYTNDILVQDPNDIPKLKVGSKVTWKYIIYNDSTKLAIDNIKLTDDKEGDISCPKATLQPSESMECFKEGIAKEGKYKNVGTVTGTIPDKNLTDEYPSNYYGTVSKIDIEKSTNGEDADTGTGPELAVGSKVTWEYKVKNTGNVKLTDIAVEDDKEGAISCPKTELDVNETMTCTQEGVVKEGQYENQATVTSKDPDGETQTDTDKSHYVGKAGACVGDFVWLDANENGIQDSGEEGIAGAKVELLDANGQPVKDINGNTITSQTTSADGAYKFCGLIDGSYIVKVTPPSGYDNSPKDQGSDDSKDSDIDPTTGNSAPVTVSEGDNNTSIDAGLFKKKAGLDIEKLTNGEDADSGTGPILTIGSKVTWEYKVKNTGNVKITDISVVDDKEGAITCPKTELAVGEEMTCTKEGVVQEGQYENQATATGKDPEGNTQTDTDISHYKGEGGACLGNFLWLDSNLNGIQDATEPGVVDIKVELYSENGTLLATTKTDSEGKYMFCKLKPGKYKVKFDQPNTYLFTLQDKGNDIKDSDVDDSGWSQVVEIKDNDKDLSIDAGIYCQCDDSKVHPDSYKQLSAGMSLESSALLVLFLYIATFTIRKARD